MNDLAEVPSSSSPAAVRALRVLGRDRPPLIVLLAVAAAYYLGARVGLALTAPPFPLSVLWPPNALLLAALLLAPQRWWWLLIVAAFPAHLLAELQESVPVAMVLCWFVSNVTE